MAAACGKSIQETVALYADDTGMEELRLLADLGLAVLTPAAKASSLTEQQQHSDGANSHAGSSAMAGPWDGSWRRACTAVTECGLAARAGLGQKGARKLCGRLHT